MPYVTGSEEASDMIAERLSLLLNAVIFQVEQQMTASPSTPLQIGDLLAAEGEVRGAFVELAAALREGTSIDLALVEWVTRVGEPAEVVITHDDGNRGGWPVWRRIA